MTDLPPAPLKPRPLYKSDNYYYHAMIWVRLATARYRQQQKLPIGGAETEYNDNDNGDKDYGEGKSRKSRGEKGRRERERLAEQENMGKQRKEKKVNTCLSTPATQYNNSGPFFKGRHVTHDTT